MATYYVRKTGNNTTGTGTTANPWQTISFGNAQLANGDTLVVGDGTYTEKITISKDNITIRAENLHAARMESGFNGYTGSVPDYSGPVKTQWDNLLYAESRTGLTVDGMFLGHSPGRGMTIYKCADFTIKNCQFHMIWAVSIAILSCDNTLFQNNDSTYMSQDRFYNIDPAQPGSFGGWSGGMIVGQYQGNPGSTNTVVEDNRFSYGQGETIGIEHSSVGAIVRNNVLWNNDTIGIYLVWVQDVEVYNNLIYFTDDHVNLGKGSMIGIQITDEIQYKTTRPFPWPNSDNMHIYNNVVIGAGDATSHRNGPRGGGILVTGDSSLTNSSIVNNTVVNSRTYGYRIWDADSPDYAYARSTSIFANNISLNSTFGDTVTAKPGDFTFYGNNTWDAAANAGTLASGTDVIGGVTLVNQFAGLSGTNGNAENYKLVTGSAAIDTGNTANGRDVDYFGATRPAGASTDIGFHEFGGVENYANFTYTAATMGIPVTFTNTSVTANAITNYAWEVDEGTGYVAFGGNVDNPNFTFATYGTFSVKLTVTTIDGSYTVTKSVTVADINSGGCTNNQVLNGEFNADLANWNDNGNVAAAWVAGEAQLTIGAADNTNRFFQEFAVPAAWVQDAVISISFDASADVAGKEIEVELRDGGAGGSIISNDQFFTLTAAMDSYTGLFTLNSTPVGPLIHFRFRFNQASSSNYVAALDNICIGENTQGAITACIDPFVTPGVSPHTTTFTATCSTSTNGIDVYQWEIPGLYATTFGDSIDVAFTRCCDYDIELTVTGEDGSDTTTETITIGGCNFTCAGNLLTEPQFENGFNTGVWERDVTGNNILSATNEFCSGYFNPAWDDSNGDIIVRLPDIVTDSNTEYTLTFETEVPFEWDKTMDIRGVDATGAFIFEETLTYASSAPKTTSITFTTDASAPVSIEFLLNNSGAVHIYNVCLVQGATNAVVLVPPTAGKYNMDGSGNISLVSFHPSWLDLYHITGVPNYAGVVLLTYNVFTGLGQGIEGVSQQVILFNIDTGNYELLTDAGVSITTGTDVRLTEFGVTAHPIVPASGAPVRGEDYWNWYQAEQATLYPTHTAEPWPTIYEAQKIKAATL